MTNLSGAVVAAVLVLGLTACSGSDDPDPAASPSPTPTPSETTSAPPTAVGRLVVQETGGSFCSDGIDRGEVVAFTGPALVVEDGPVTIDGVGSTDLRVTEVGAVQFTPGLARQPGFVVADTLDELDPEGRPYLEDTEGALEGETFEAGVGVVPLLEVRAAWPSTQEGGDVFVEQPPLTVTWRAEGGEAQLLEVPMPVELHSLEGACSR